MAAEDSDNTLPPGPDKETLGAWLKKHRDKKKISLEEIAAVTKIHITQLRHLEEDRLELLPAAAFVRGFLLSYARHLSIDEDQVLEKFREARGDQGTLEKNPGRTLRAPRSASEPKVKVVASPQFSTRSPSARSMDNEGKVRLSPRQIVAVLGIAGFLVLVALLIFIGKKSMQKEKVVESDVDPALVIPKVETVAPAPAKSVAPAPAPTPTASVVPAGKKYALEVHALEGNWLSVRIDDESARGVEMKAGATLNFQADRRMIISLSNAGAVEMRWNGVPYAPAGFRGDVKSLSLPNDLKLFSPRASKIPVPVRKMAPAVVPKPADGAAPTAPPAPAPTPAP